PAAGGGTTARTGRTARPRPGPSGGSGRGAAGRRAAGRAWVTGGRRRGSMLPAARPAASMWGVRIYSRISHPIRFRAVRLWGRRNPRYNPTAGRETLPTTGLIGRPARVYNRAEGRRGSPLARRRPDRGRCPTPVPRVPHGQVETCRTPASPP